MKRYYPLDDEAFEQIMSKLDNLEKRLQPTKSETGIGWLNNEQLCAALQISKRTAQNYRDQGLIPFSLVGGKVYYKVDDVQALLTKNLNIK